MINRKIRLNIYIANFNTRTLDKKPKNGGKPPKDIKIKINIILSKLFILFIWINEFVPLTL